MLCDEDPGSSLDCIKVFRSKNKIIRSRSNKDFGAPLSKADKSPGTLLRCCCSMLEDYH